MRTLLLALLTAAVLLPAVPARAQDASQAVPTELQLELKRKRHVVRPRPSPAPAEPDVERAQAQVRQRAREEALIRQEVAPPPRRPDTSYDAVSGIQARTLQKATGR